MKNENLIEDLSSQLSKPTGENGIEVGNAMNQTNKEMITSSIDLLEVKNHDKILEIGHGNCSHLTEIIKDKNVHYSGLEISETMKKEAERINEKFIKLNQAQFLIYDGNKIPFEDQKFDQIFTVNTIYFWENHELFLNEIYRVLKPNGKFILTFVNEDFMKDLDFVDDNFQLFNEEKAKTLLEKSGFKIISIKNKTDNIKSKIGDLANRDYMVIISEKS
ncbi:class I SAM-dependent methyltransferase [Aureivirga sp. CE67]|uniref:class I SAM-dependent methyltransferase n=1 Tax=Aureivirga sp. CE67 TaxID=1788983 RepID=UPI0018CA7F49|nr:class I SAM-dependent methyltransferase [Aureivirga sp. CE67]